MNFRNLLLQKYILTWMVIGLLSLTTVVFGLFALTNKSELRLIAIDNNGTRIITDNEDPVFKTEVITFIRTFVTYFYNFDQDTYPENLGKASDLMSIELWKDKKDDIVKMGEQIKKDPTQLSSHITKIEKESETYFVSLSTTEFYRAKKTDRSVKLKITIQKTTRTPTNPWGIEVTSLEEITE